MEMALNSGDTVADLRDHFISTCRFDLNLSSSTLLRTPIHAADAGLHAAALQTLNYASPSSSSRMAIVEMSLSFNLLNVETTILAS